MTFSINDDLAFALALAAEADLISLDRYRAQDLDVQVKPDRTPVTDADKRVEQEIRARIPAARPGDSILGEEFGAEEFGTVEFGTVDSGSDGSSSRQWIIDPIDGTANFMRGVPIWGTLIALAIDGVPVVGVVSSPALGKRWWAAQGHGAWLQQGGETRQIQVSGIATLAEASLSYNSLKGWEGEGKLDALMTLNHAVWRSRAYGDMWAYMLVAEGAIDIAGEFDLKPYDMAALIPIIEEAGGRFSSASGLPGPWHGSAIATNGLLHDAVLEIVAKN